MEDGGLGKEDGRINQAQRQVIRHAMINEFSSVIFIPEEKLLESESDSSCSSSSSSSDASETGSLSLKLSRQGDHEDNGNGNDDDDEDDDDDAATVKSS